MCEIEWPIFTFACTKCEIGRENLYKKKYMIHILNLAGNDFVMYRLIHINRSQYVFVT